MDDVAGQAGFPGSVGVPSGERLGAAVSVDEREMGPSGAMTLAEEREFWAGLQAAYPDWFAAQQVAPDEDAVGSGWSVGEGAVRCDATGRAVVDAEALRVVRPSGLLMDLLASVDPHDETRVDDLAVVEVVAAWQRVAAHAQAQAALAAGALSRRACLQVPGSVPVGRGRRSLTTLRATGTELAIRTGCSVRAGELMARDGRLLAGQLWPTADAWLAGDLDAVKARLICDRLAEASVEVAVAVQDAVLPGAAGRSWAELDGDLARALVATDPLDATHRHTQARKTRRVCHPRPLPDGMAGIWAVLPAEDAMGVDATLQAVAVSAKATGDRRTLDQLRADTLTQLITDTWGLAQPPPHPGPGGEATPAAGPGGPAERSAGSHGPATTRTGEPEPGPRRGAAVHVEVTVSLDTLLGVDDAPGDLAGYGAITATAARALAAGGTWRRIVTDPLSGTVLDVGRTTYRPPAAIRDHVIARDRVCIRPRCTVPARRCELDHTIPYGPDRPPGDGPPTGPTSADNLGPGCAHDHTLKTLGLHHYTQVSPGVFEITTATGLRLRITPGQHGRTQILPRTPHPDPTKNRGADPPIPF